jgi:hypothetical protein
MKKAIRKAANKAAKQKKAETRKQFMALLGKTVQETQVPVINEETGVPETNEDGTPKTTTVLDFPSYIKTAGDGTPLPFKGTPQQRPSSLAFIGAKAYPQQGLSRKGRPGEKYLHAAAVIEDASRTFAKEVDKILNPPPVETNVPVVPVDAAELAAAV